jgi:flagellar hook-associated protein 2
MGLTPLRFSGISQFSQDFQMIVDRTVQIAALPARALQNDQMRLLSQKSALADLRNPVAALAASLRGLDSLGVSRSLTGSSSQPSKVAVSLPDAAQAQPGSFTITDITSLAQRAIVTSTSGWASATEGPVAGAGGVLELVVGGQSLALTLEPGSDHLAGARDAINAANAGVTASLIHANGEVFLSVSANQTGARAIELRTTPGEAGANLLGVTQEGADAVFKVNGQTVTSPENYISGVIPGAALTLKGTTTGSESILIEIAGSRAPLAQALRNFASAYNELTSRIQQAEPLRGHSLINDLMGRVRSLHGQFGEGSIRGLAEIGVTVDRDGVMSVDELTLQSLPESRMEGVFAFLRASGAGLGTMAARFEEISDPVSGWMTEQIRSWDAADARTQKQIDAIYERVNAVQLTMSARLQAADVLLARLEGQQGLLDASIQSLQFTMFGRKDR